MLKMKIPDIATDKSMIDTLRFWLIKKLAGKTVVVMNTNIHFVARKEFEPLQVDAKDGAYFQSVGFPVDGRTILRFEQK